MSDRPILLRMDHVRALSRGAKAHYCVPAASDYADLEYGDELWVREALIIAWCGDEQRLHYRADVIGSTVAMPTNRWRSSIQDAQDMERSQSRWVLKVISTHTFPLQQISVETRHYEGIPLLKGQTLRGWMRAHYFEIPWDDDPQVIGISFAPEYRNIDGRALAPLKDNRVR